MRGGDFFYFIFSRSAILACQSCRAIVIKTTFRLLKLIVVHDAIKTSFTKDIKKHFDD